MPSCSTSQAPRFCLAPGFRVVHGFGLNQWFGLLINSLGFKAWNLGFRVELTGLALTGHCGKLLLLAAPAV